MKLLFSAVCATLLFCQATSAAPQEKITMNTFSVISEISLPPWSKAASFGEDNEFYREQGKTPNDTEIFIWEAIPKGDSFDDWTKLYALTAEFPITGDIELLANGVLKTYSQTCSKVSVQSSRTTPDDVKLFVIWCDSNNDNPEFGEIAFFKMKLTNQTLVKNYLNFRVPSFTLSGNSIGPISVDDFQKYITTVGQLNTTARGPN